MTCGDTFPHNGENCPEISLSFDELLSVLGLSLFSIDVASRNNSVCRVQIWNSGIVGFKTAPAFVGASRQENSKVLFLTEIYFQFFRPDIELGLTNISVWQLGRRVDFY